MSSAFDEYVDGAFDAYPFSNDGDRDVVERFLDWMQHEYEPTDDAAPIPSPATVMAEHDLYPVVMLADDEDVTGRLTDMGLIDVPVDQRRELMRTWADELLSYLPAIPDKILDLAFEDAVRMTLQSDMDK